MTAKKTILVIDDDPSYLDFSSYQILSARSGEEGLLIAREGKPNAVILDVLLPGLPAMGVVRRLRSDPRTSDIPIFIVTAAHFGPDFKDSLLREGGVSGYFDKMLVHKPILRGLLATL